MEDARYYGREARRLIEEMCDDERARGNAAMFLLTIFTAPCGPCKDNGYRSQNRGNRVLLNEAINRLAYVVGREKITGFQCLRAPDLDDDRRRVEHDKSHGVLLSASAWNVRAKGLDPIEVFLTVFQLPNVERLRSILVYMERCLATWAIYSGNRGRGREAIIDVMDRAIKESGADPWYPL